MVSVCLHGARRKKKKKEKKNNEKNKRYQLEHLSRGGGDEDETTIAIYLFGDVPCIGIYPTSRQNIYLFFFLIILNNATKTLEYLQLGQHTRLSS